MLPVSAAMYSWVLNSEQDPFAIYKNWMNSLFPFRSNPSDILEGIETEDL